MSQSKESNKKSKAKNPAKYKALKKAWREAHKEKSIEYVKRWFARNPDKRKAQTQKRRAAILGCEGHFSAYEWRMLCDQYDNRCLKCGQRKKLTPDHVVPLSLGGSDSIDNIQPLCRNCNSSKNTKTVDYRNREPIHVIQLSIFGA